MGLGEKRNCVISTFWGVGMSTPEGFQDVQRYSMRDEDASASFPLAVAKEHIAFGTNLLVLQPRPKQNGSQIGNHITFRSSLNLPVHFESII